VPVTRSKTVSWCFAIFIVPPRTTSLVGSCNSLFAGISWLRCLSGIESPEKDDGLGKVWFIQGGGAAFIDVEDRIGGGNNKGWEVALDLEAMLTI